jgi:hypothetical protein
LGFLTLKISSTASGSARSPAVAAADGLLARRCLHFKQHWTHLACKSQGTIDSLVRRIKAGTVWVNTYNVYDAGNCLYYGVISLKFIASGSGILRAAAQQQMGSNKACQMLL